MANDYLILILSTIISPFFSQSVSIPSMLVNYGEKRKGGTRALKTDRGEIKKERGFAIPLSN